MDMKTSELIPQPTGSAAKIARELARAISKDIAPQDQAQAAENAVARFAQQLRTALKAELKFSTTKKV